MGRDVAMLAQVLHTTLRATGSEAAGTAGSEPLTTRKRAYAAELRAQSAERRDQRAPGGASGGSGVPTVPQLCPSAAAGVDAGRKVSRVLETVGGGNPPPEAGPLPGNDQGMAQRRGGVESRILRVLRRPLADGAVVALASVFALGTLSAPAQSNKTDIRVTWYGGDGSAQAKQLVDNAQTVAFAEKTGRFPSPLVALPKGAENRHHALLKQITRRAKATVDAFGLAAYDAVRVGVRALVAAGANADAAALRSAFTNAADDYKGITGKIELDQNGDRASAPYAFWSICFKKSPAWHRTGTWTPGADPTGPGRTTVTGCPKTKT